MAVGVSKSPPQACTSRVKEAVKISTYRVSNASEPDGNYLYRICSMRNFQDKALAMKSPG
jgi:hypothetical protein